MEDSLEPHRTIGIRLAIAQFDISTIALSESLGDGKAQPCAFPVCGLLSSLRGKPHEPLQGLLTMFRQDAWTIVGHCHPYR